MAKGKGNDIRLAATVIICRELPKHLIDDDNFDYEILLLKRRKEARFMPNHYVFPGGLVERSDYLPINSPLFPSLEEDVMRDDKKRALKVAAIRESFEESNLLLVDDHSPLPPPSSISSWKEKVLHSPLEFVKMCESLNVKISINNVYEWVHWITPEFEKYRYDTYFFLTSIPYSSSTSVAHDQKEIVAYEWIKPNIAIDRYLQGDLRLAPPTWITIFELYQHRSFSSLLSLAKAGRNMHPILPVIGVASELAVVPDNNNNKNNNNKNNNNNNANNENKDEKSNKIYLYLPGDEKSNEPLGKDVKRRILIDHSSPAPYTLINHNFPSSPQSNL